MVRPGRRGAAAGLAVLAAAQLATAGPGLRLLLAVIGWGIAGTGMGLSYPRLSARPFDGLPPQRTLAVGTAVAFAESAGTAIGSLLGGGLFSLAHGAAIAASTSISWAYALLAAVAAAAGTLAARQPREPGGMTAAA